MRRVERPIVLEPQHGVRPRPAPRAHVLLGRVLVVVLVSCRPSLALAVRASEITALIMDVLADVRTAQPETDVMVALIAMSRWHASIGDVSLALGRMAADAQRLLLLAPQPDYSSSETKKIGHAEKPQAWARYCAHYSC